MLRTKTHPHDPRWKTAQPGESLQKPERQRKPANLDLVGHRGAKSLFVDHHLYPLDHSCRKCAPFLDASQMFIADRAFQQGLRQNVCSRYGILNGKIDADTSDRGHGVRGVANA